MSENVVITPGLVGLKNKKSGAVTQHHPVDIREILEVCKGQYEIVQNGAIEAARLSATPLSMMQQASDSIAYEVTGQEGMVMVMMTKEEAASREEVKPVEPPKKPEEKPDPAKK